jgi:hypothetical protein
MPSDTSLLSFKAISDFINDLLEVFGDEQRSLQLYARLIAKTTIAHENAISRHANAFRKFCVDNREAFLSSDDSLIVNKYIEYSENVRIDMADIFSKSDKETKKAIWKHLLTIFAIVDPSGEARRILKDSSTSAASATETDFLTDIIGKIEKHVDPNANPMEAITSIMSSGVFTDLIGGMGAGLQNGTLDMNKLMGTVQKMVSTISPPSDNNSASMPPLDLASMMKMVMPPTSSGEGDGASVPPIDLNAMMKMMMPPASGEAGGPPALDLNAMMKMMMPPNPGGGGDSAMPNPEDLMKMLNSMNLGKKDIDPAD